MELPEIGRGAQYKVFDTGDDRVLKVPLTFAESRDVVAGWYPSSKEFTDAELGRVARYRDEAIDSTVIMQGILAESPELAPYIGNPEFHEEGEYTQDKLDPLRQRVQEGPVQDAKELLRAYVASNITLWGFGFAEQIFNFSPNNGTNKNGDVTLMDFGIITTGYKRAAELVRSKNWLFSRSYKVLPNPELRRYYEEITDEQLTLESLAGAWRQRRQS